MKALIENNRDYLFARLPGAYSLTQFRAIIERLSEMCRRYDQSRLLVDARENINAVGTFERFELGNLAVQAFPPGTRIAIVVRENKLGPDRFFETVAHNRGGLIRVFSTMEEAEPWLLKNP